jgi:hypothetical protein
MAANCEKKANKKKKNRLLVLSQLTASKRVASAPARFDKCDFTLAKQVLSQLSYTPARMCHSDSKALFHLTATAIACFRSHRGNAKMEDELAARAGHKLVGICEVR